MQTKTKCLIVLLTLMMIDILPIPIVGMIGIYVILRRPPWFLHVVQRLYNGSQ